LGKQYLTRFTCDQCQILVEVKAGVVPDGWTILEIKSSRTKPPSELIVLCPECTEKLEILKERRVR